MTVNAYAVTTSHTFARLDDGDTFPTVSEAWVALAVDLEHSDYGQDVQSHALDVDTLVCQTMPGTVRLTTGELITVQGLETVAYAWETSATSADYLRMRLIEESVSLGVELSPWGRDTLERVQFALSDPFTAWTTGELADDLDTLADQVENDVQTLDRGFRVEWDGGWTITAPVVPVEALADHGPTGLPYGWRMRPVWAFMTASVYTPEEDPGTGDCEYVESHGWVDPSWSLNVLHDSRNDVRPVGTWNGDDDDLEEYGDLNGFIRRMCAEYLNGTEDNGDGTVYSADATETDHTLRTGESWTYALHFTHKWNPHPGNIHTWTESVIVYTDTVNPL